MPKSKQRKVTVLASAPADLDALFEAAEVPPEQAERTSKNGQGAVAKKQERHAVAAAETAAAVKDVGAKCQLALGDEGVEALAEASRTKAFLRRRRKRELAAARTAAKSVEAKATAAKNASPKGEPSSQGQARATPATTAAASTSQAGPAKNCAATISGNAFRTPTPTSAASSS